MKQQVGQQTMQKKQRKRRSVYTCCIIYYSQEHFIIHWRITAGLYICECVLGWTSKRKEGHLTRDFLPASFNYSNMSQVRPLF